MPSYSGVLSHQKSCAVRGVDYIFRYIVVAHNHIAVIYTKFTDLCSLHWWLSVTNLGKLSTKQRQRRMRRGRQVKHGVNRKQAQGQNT